MWLERSKNEHTRPVQWRLCHKSCTLDVTTENKRPLGEPSIACLPVASLNESEPKRYRVNSDNRTCLSKVITPKRRLSNHVLHLHVVSRLEVAVAENDCYF